MKFNKKKNRFPEDEFKEVKNANGGLALIFLLDIRHKHNFFAHIFIADFVSMTII